MKVTLTVHNGFIGYFVKLPPGTIVTIGDVKYEIVDDKLKQVGDHTIHHPVPTHPVEISQLGE
jgi:hypothetical protein